MKYFVTNGEREGTCYHEFYRGKWDSKTFWNDDSIYLHDDVLLENRGFADALLLVVPNYDPYRDTEVSSEDWARVGKAIRQDDRGSLELYDEAGAWLEEVFKTEDCFTILGV